ncbi:Kelch repeat-containing protein 1 [Nymphon striatum]|nr:Kelch repeat-containing protein 1 [Nymphon striatum]
MEIVENGLLLVFGRTSNPIDQIIVEQLPRPQQFTVEVLSTDGGFIGVPFFEEYRYFIIPGGNPATFKNKMLVIGGYEGYKGNARNDIWQSKNGKLWSKVLTSKHFSPRTSHTTTLANGTDWKIATSNADFSPRSGHTSVVYNNLMWVLGGNENEENKPGDLWLSKDGENLNPTTLYNGDISSSSFQLIERLNLLTDYYWKVEATDAAGKISQNMIIQLSSFDNKLWLIGGVIDGEGSNNYTNDVWYSEDGLKWTEATPNAEFSKRSFQATVTFNNKLWLIGGLNSELVGDVWSSVDGVTWTEEVAEAPFSYRYYHTATVFNNKIWLIGGNSEGGNALDVWYSENRIDWVMATANISTAKISRPGTVVFKDKLLVFGGSRDSSFNYTNEVWQSEDGVKWNKLAANSSCHHYKARTY